MSLIWKHKQCECSTTNILTKMQNIQTTQLSKNLSLPTHYIVNQTQTSKTKVNML